MKYNVTDIEFDFDDGNDGESYPLTFDEEIAIRDSALGVWEADNCLLYTSPSPRDGLLSRMPSSA